MTWSRTWDYEPPSRSAPKSRDANTHRRAHGLARAVRITPSIIAKAKKRERLYLHSAARKRAGQP